MIVPTFAFPSTMYLIPISDVHYGSPTHEQRAFQNTIEILKKAQRNSNEHYYCFMGDVLENIVRDCVAGSYDQVNLPHEQMEFIVDCFKSLKGTREKDRNKGLFAVYGNHENRTKKHAYFDMLVGLCDRLGLKYMGLGGYVRFNVGNICYTLAVQHGDCAGNWENEMKRMRNNFPDADIYLMGHTHDLVAEYRPFIKINPDGTQGEDYKIFCRCGSYCGYPGYAQVKNYEKKVTGSLKIKFNGDKKLITVDKLIYINGELIEA